MMGMVLQLKAAMTFNGACPVGIESPPFFIYRLRTLAMATLHTTLHTGLSVCTRCTVFLSIALSIVSLFSQ